MSKAKFNFIDAIIILLILAVIAAGLYMFLGGGLFTTSAGGDGETSKIQYSVEIKQKTRDYCDNINVGDAVQIGDKEKASAVIEDIDIVPTKMLFEDKKSGVVHYSEIPEMYDIILTLSSDGRHTDSAIYADNVLVRIGERVTVRGKGYSGNGFVMSLDVEE